MFFIFFGRQKTKKKLGYAAEFCPVCRGITPFHVSRIGMGEHLYGVSLGTTSVLGHEAICHQCNTRTGANVAAYSAFAKRPGSDIEELIRTSFPNIRQARALRLVLEKQLHEGTLGGEDRQLLLDELFTVFNQTTEHHFTGTIESGGNGAYGCLGTVVAAAAILFVGNLFLIDEHQREVLLKVAAVIALVGGFASLVSMARAPRRIFKRRVVPPFAAALKPLQPTRSELADRLGRFKREGFKLGKRLKPEDLERAVEAANSTPTSVNG